MSNRRKSSTGKTILSVIAIVLALVLVCGVVVVGYRTEWFSDFSVFEQVEEETTDDDNGGMVVNDTDSGSTLSLSMVKLSADEYEEYGISPLAETAYTITVTPDPSDATDTYSWSCTNTSQISLSVSSNTKNCAVSCSGAFGTQAIITVTSNSNSDLSAEVTVDYVKRLSSVTYTLSGGAVSFSSSTSSSVTTTITATPVWGTGTITPTFTITGGTLSNNLTGTTSSVTNSVSNSSGGTTYYSRFVSETKDVTFDGATISVTTPYASFVSATSTSSSSTLSVTPLVVSIGYPTETQLASAYNNSFATIATGTTSDGTLTVNYTISYTPSGSYAGSYSTSGSSSVGVAFDVSALAITATDFDVNYDGVVF